MTAEGDLVRATLSYLEARGVLAWRNNTGGFKKGKHWIRVGTLGSGDILGILPGGRFLTIECKVGKNVESKAQEAFRGRVTDVGGLAIVIRSLDDLEEALWPYARKAD